MNELGHLGEQHVVAFLTARGFTIRTCNFHCRGGEVDVIAQKNNVIAFVEVKTRRREYFPTECVVDYAKQQKIIRAAQSFVMRHELEYYVLRFDVAIVVGDQSSLRVATYIEDAFQS